MFVFEVGHEYVGQGGGHSGPHGRSSNLEVILSIEFEIIKITVYTMYLVHTPALTALSTASSAGMHSIRLDYCTVVHRASQLRCCVCLAQTIYRKY